MVAPAELSLAHADRSGGPAAGPRFRLVPRMLQSGDNGAGRIGLPSCLNSRCTAAAAYPSQTANQLPSPVSWRPGCEGCQSRHPDPCPRRAASQDRAAYLGHSSGRRRRARPADGPDPPTDQISFVSGGRCDEVIGPNTVGKISTRAAQKGHHRPHVCRAAIKEHGQARSAKSSARAPRGTRAQLGRLGAAGRERPLLVVGHQG